MNYRRFLSFNLLGGVLWAVGVTVLGYFLADVIGPDNIDKYLLPIIAVIILISVAPPALHLLKEKENRDAIRANIGKLLRRNGAVKAESGTEPVN
jgi:membrane-associated protein